jgi:NCS1 family nucleobase:cation symporter-1
MGLPSKSAFKAAFQSKEAFKDFVQSAESLDNHTAVGQSRWTNKDLEPTPPEQRTWTW